jgi:ring-1,2-phenylacetyl-CoA epoxidase subunit PaaD
MVTAEEHLLDRAREAVTAVADPEIPGVGIVDLGIVRKIDQRDGVIVVTITPTYSGCPAMSVIESEIGAALRGIGIQEFRIDVVLTPAWSTSWITEAGKKRLLEAGIAPPASATPNIPILLQTPGPGIQCPYCGSNDTNKVSEFGSTSCKAYHRCNQCLSTFEYFKPF